MRTSTVSAAFLLVGAGAAALAAVEPGGGNNLVLNGSDTLFDVTKAVIASCGTPKPADGGPANGMGFLDFVGDHISYLGGGSGVGAGQMGLGLQELSPMSRAMKNSEYCTPGATAAGEGAAAANSEALLVGIDGVAITANQTNSCAASTGVATGLGAASFAVTGTCAGCDASGNYTLGGSTNASIYVGQPSFDALAIIYFGLTHDNFYDCSGNVRKSLIKNWGALFNASCAGSGNCPNGLTHAWRRSDLSGTTDAFVSVLLPSGTFTNGSATNGKGAAETDATGAPLSDLNCAGSDNVTLGQCKETIGIGTLSNVPAGKAKKSNPFCNSADANSAVPTATPPVSAALSFGGSSDFSDLDPIRTACVAKDGVCEAFKTPAARFAGDLGVVLPILLPDATVTVSTDLYPVPKCGAACALIPIARTAAIPSTFRCPSGGKPFAGNCYMPVVAQSSPPDPRCIASQSQTCIDTVGQRDGRTYNQVTIAESAAAGTKNAGGTYQFAFDANNRFMSGSFYRVRSTPLADSTNTGSGICQQNDDTSQIGCLTDADTCSIGYAGRESAQSFPDTGAPTSAPLKALALNGGSGFVPPFAPTSAAQPDADLFLENLLTAGQTVYPLARRLYVATQYGFGSNMAGGEKELAQCYATNGIVTPAITGNGFVAVPANNGHSAGVECIDYKENGASNASPAPNVQGPGAVALPGCALATITTNNDACQGASAPTDSFGGAVPESL